MSLKILSGRDDPLGAIASADGTNFAVSSGGDEVTLCLFDADGSRHGWCCPNAGAASSPPPRPRTYGGSPRPAQK
jgi:hypothetical protein